MKGKVKAIVFGLVLAQALGCATIPPIHPRAPLPNKRKGFFSRFVTSSPSESTSSSSASEEASSSPQILDPSLQAKGLRLQWPLSSIKVTSPFGKRGRDRHEGLDLRAKIGTPVYAAEAGVVLYAGSKIRGYGKMLVIRHRPNLATVYAHNSQLQVKAGQKIRRGQRIALSGNTGRSSGPHLHFEIRQGVEALNPLHHLPTRKKQLPARLTASNPHFDG